MPEGEGHQTPRATASLGLEFCLRRDEQDFLPKENGSLEGCVKIEVIKTAAV